MVRLGNNKNLTIFYLGTAATAKLITTILHYKLIPFDIGLQEFLILLSCAVTLCIGPFRCFISGECEKKMLFVFLVLTYGAAQYFTLFSNSNLGVYYTCLTGMTTLLLYIFRYKEISSLLLADVYLFMVFLEYNLGYIDAKYMSYSLLYLFSINMIHALLSYLQLSSDSSAKKNLSWLEASIINNFGSLSKIRKEYIDLIFCLVPMIFGINLASILVTSYLLTLIVIKKYLNLNSIEDVLYSYIDRLKGYCENTRFEYSMPELPKKAFAIRLNLSYTIALVFIILGILASLENQ